MLTKRILVVGYLLSLLLLNLHTTESTSYQEDNAEAVTIKEQKQTRRGRRSGYSQSRGRRSCDPLYRYLFETCGHWPFPTAPSLDNPFLPFKPPPSSPRPRPSPRLAPPLVPSPPPPPPSPLVPSAPPPSPPPFFVFPSPPPPVIVNFPPPLVPSPPPPLVPSPPPPLVPSPPPPQSGGDMMQPPPLWLPPPSSQYETPPIFSLPPQEDAFLPMPPIVWVPPPDVTAQSSSEEAEAFDQIPPPLM